MPSSRAAVAFRRVVQVEEGEGPRLFWACAYFFCLMTGYFLIRPLRDEKGLSAGRDVLNLLFVFTLAGTVVANPLFAALVARFPRRVFIPAAYGFFAANLLVFAALFWTLKSNFWVASAFYVWTSVFNLFVVSVFWGFMSDVFRSDQAKRLYGFIGIWGTLGTIVGPTLTKRLISELGPHGLVLFSAAFLGASVFCMMRLSRRAPTNRVDEIRRAQPGGAASLLVGVRRTFASPYLIAISGYVLLFTITSTLIYFQQANVASDRTNFPDELSRTRFFATVEQCVQVLTLIVQCFFTSRIIRWLGIGGTLAILPMLTLGGGVALWIAPLAAVLLVLLVVRRAGDFSAAKPAREVLFTVVDREEKYVAKNFMDTFVYRSGDLAGSGIDMLLKKFAFGTREVAILFVPLAGAWLALSLFLGRRHAERAKAQSAG